MSFDFEDASIYVNNLTLEGNTLGSRDINGNVNIIPDGSGDVNLGNLDSTVRLTATKYASAGLLQVDTDGNVLTTGEFTYRGTTNATSGDPVRTIQDTSGSPTIDRVNVTSAAIGWDWATKAETTGVAGTTAYVKDAMAIDSEDNIVSIGTFSTGTLNLYNEGDALTPASTMTLVGTVDGAITKYSKDGVLQWRARIAGAGATIAQCHVVINPADNSIYLFGSYDNASIQFYDASDIAVGSILPGSTFPRHFLAKYSSSGNLIWRTYINPSDRPGIPYSLSLDIDGNVYVLAGVRGAIFGTQFYNADNTVGTFLANASFSLYITALAKYSPDGFLAWASAINPGTTNTGTITPPVGGIAVTPAGNVYACGTTIGGGTTTLFDPADTPFGTTATGTANYTFICKYDTNGSPLWLAKIDGNGNDNSSKLTIDELENIYLSGTYNNVAAPVTAYNSDGSASGETLTTLAGAEDAYLCKYNNVGFAQWITRIAASASTDFIYGIYVRDGILHVCGSYTGSNLTAYDDGGTATSNSVSIIGAAVSTDSFIVKYNTNGIAFWISRVSGSAADTMLTIALNSQGDLYVQGTSTSTQLQLYDVKTSVFGVSEPKDGTAVQMGTLTKLNQAPCFENIGLVNDTIPIADGADTDVITSNLFIDEALGGLFTSNEKYYVEVTDIGELALTTTKNNNFFGTAIDENTLLVGAHSIPENLTVTSLTAETVSVTDTLEVDDLTTETVTTGKLTFANESGEPTVTAIDSNGTLIKTGIDIDSFSCEQKITAGDAQANDEFGQSVSISGNVAIVGAYLEDAGGVTAGAAYIFEKSGGIWAQTEKLVASDAEAGDEFGWSVSISGNVAIVGASREDTEGNNAGAAYIFEKSGGTWTETQKLTAGDAEASDFFGESVSVSGNVAIVGANGEDTGGADAGAAYIFEKSGGVWTETAKLVASDAEASDNFGKSVAVSGNVAIVGANGEDTGGAGAGAAYIFEKSGGVWTETEKLVASDAEAGDGFGYSVSVSGNVAIVGAYLEDTGGSNAGAAYIYEKSGGTWIQTKKLIAGNAETFDLFGRSVSVSGNVVIVGAIGEDTGGSAAGAAYIYDNTLEVPCLAVGAVTGATTISPNRITAAGGDALGALSIATGLIFVTTTIGAATPVESSLPNGLADGQILRIVASDIDASAPFNIDKTGSNIIDANGSVPANGFQLQSTGDSIMIVWDATIGAWFILGSGALVI
jgi:hypothetical protein